MDEGGRPIPPAGVGRWLARVVPRGARGTVNLVFLSDVRVRDLNRRYRGVDRATDVLSFPYTAPEGGSHEPFLGEIVIARGAARRQAREAGHSEATEHRVLALHGLLHLLGYDHERDKGRMARLERRLLKQGGVREGLIERRSRGHG
jgi:probable rRNA maturation factor